MNIKRKGNGLIIDVAMIVLVLAVFSSIFASDFLAKYRSGEGAADAASVAKWGVGMSAEPQIEVLPGGQADVTYPIVVTNASETAVSYDITVVFGQSVTDIISNPRLNGTVPAQGAFYSTQLTFFDAGTLPASDGSEPQTETVNLTFTVPDEYLEALIGSGEDYDNEIISGAVAQISFHVSAVIRQID